MAERGAAMESVLPELLAPLMRIAEHQEEFVPVMAARVNHPAYPGRENTTLLAFRPSADERERIAQGQDIYIALLTFGQPMQGIVVLAGKDDASAVYNVPAFEAYKGYRAKIEYDPTSRSLHGEVIGIRDVLTFESRVSMLELAEAFRDSVDDYLAMCTERGEAPDSPDESTETTGLRPSSEGKE